MESFYLSFGIVMPMFLTLLTGWGIRQKKILTESGFSALNTLCFKLLLPMSLFCNIYNGGNLNALNARMIIWAFLCQGLVLLLLFLIVPRIFHKNPVRASIIQACFRANFITFVISCIISLGLVLFQIKLPTTVQSAAKSIAGCAVPVSFLALGGCLNLKAVAGYKKEIFLAYYIAL